MLCTISHDPTVVPPVDAHRVAELATKLWWLAQVHEVLITAPVELDPCGYCPEARYDDEPGPDPADAVIAYRLVGGRWAYREPVCAGCLTQAVRQIAATATTLVVEVPAVTL